MDYRIVIVTQRNGVKRFYVQQRFWRFIWFYRTETKDITMHRYKISFDTLESAQSYIDKCVSAEYANWCSQVVKKEIYS